MARLQRLIVGAPFGNYFSRPGVTSTLGTFTKEHRGGFWKRLWRVLLTVRYQRRLGGWINRLGLPSPALNDFFCYNNRDFSQDIISIHGFDKTEWLDMLGACSRHSPLAVELNFSCPNVKDRAERKDLYEVAHEAVRLSPVIVKLPPLRWDRLTGDMFDAGVRCFHCCNTIPTPSGGLSGKTLKQYSLWAIDAIRGYFGDRVSLIGGGGVTCLQDAKDYISAGADHVAVASMLFNPFNWRKLAAIRDHLEEAYGPAPDFRNDP